MSTNEREALDLIVDQMRKIVDQQVEGDAVVLVERQTYNKLVGKIVQVARALSAPPPAREAGKPVEIDYTNWRGERGIRRILPMDIFYGSNEWHPEPQWLIAAVDIEKGAVRTFALAGIGAPSAREAGLREALDSEQIKHMVERFLSWKLPPDFRPDAGITFKAEFNEHTPWPMKHEPTGTNLLDYGQAEAMVRHMLEDLPGTPTPAREATRADTLESILRQRFARSAPVEEQLMLIGAGKRPLPTADECREWAVKLGVPEQASEFAPAREVGLRGRPRFPPLAQDRHGGSTNASASKKP